MLIFILYIQSVQAKGDPNKSTLRHTLVSRINDRYIDRMLKAKSKKEITCDEAKLRFTAYLSTMTQT